MTNVAWQEIRLVVFDVDGTLYDQRPLRMAMMRQLLGHCLRHPGDLRILRYISEYRRCRDQLAEKEAAGIADLQYRWPAERLGIEPQEVRRTIEEWMLRRPLAHLRPCRYAKVADLFAALRSRQVKVAVLSDYPAADKLRALGLEASLAVSAVDPEVDRLKPHPRGLLRCLELAQVEPRQALMVGDREDRDGESARRAGVGCLIKTAEATTSENHFRDYEELVRSLHECPAEDAALQ